MREDIEKASFPSYPILAANKPRSHDSFQWLIVVGRSRLPLDGDPAVDPKPIEFPFRVAVNTQGEEKEARHPHYGMVPSIPFNGWTTPRSRGQPLSSRAATRGDEDRFFMERMDVPGGSPPGSAGWIQSKVKTVHGHQMDWESTRRELYLSSTRVDDAGVLLESKITAFDLSGDFLWETSSTALGLGPLQPIDMLQTANGATYVVHERWNTPEDADIEIWLLNASGTLLWRQIIALPDGTAERPSAMKVNHQGDLILAGTTETALQGRRSFWAPYNKMEQARGRASATIDGRC